MARIGNDPGREDPSHLNGRDTNIPRVIDDRDKPIREHVVPIPNDFNPGIVRPHIQAQHFELKSVKFQMLQTVGKFSGLPIEDPRLHSRLFLKIVPEHVAGTMELDVITSLTAQVSSLTNMIKALKRPTVVQEMKVAELTCVYYGEDHVFDECLSNPALNVTSAPPGYNQPLPWQNVQQILSSTSYMEALLKEYIAKNDVVI
ncbi:aspartic proteinase CDR1-like [Gossypium australe]|uniref:Aspartic proteinase CDR1-like n=1 Tax=Gossypium australe TaxID=47621 RepID=A0A5B6UQ07_9ROSI|nr:aspartic proteinase CDR1-like [Gossypium australe]